MAERVAALLPEDLPAVRRVQPSLLHVTLAFIGHVPAEMRDPAVAALRRALGSSRRFRLELRGLGQFPLGRRPRTVWLGIPGTPGERLTRLAWQVREALARAEVPFDEKPFRPHVTLARVRQDLTAAEATAIRGALRRETPPIRLDVEAVSLVESLLSPKGPRYTTLERFRLAGG